MDSNRPRGRPSAERRRTSAWGASLALLVAIAAATLAWVSAGRGATQEPIVAVPDAGAPPVALFGASPQEAAGEVWGVTHDEAFSYTDAGGWSALPAPLGASGQVTYPAGSPGGDATPAGGVALLAADTSGQRLLSRDPGGQLQAAPDPGALLGPGGSLYPPGGSGQPLLAAAGEAGGGTGAFVVPSVSGGTPTAVLHLAAGAWSTEAICTGPTPVPCNPPGAGFAVLGVDATGPANAWLLATDPAAGAGLELFARDPASETWRERSLGPGLGALYAQASPALPGGGSATVAPRATGQPLTVTSAGVWADAAITAAGGSSTDATLYFDPAAGSVSAAWCDGGEALAALCTRPLDSQLPAGGSRSFAWPPDGQPGDPFGARTITGVGHGSLLVLEGEAFKRVPAGGGDAGVAGSALYAPEEGWLSSSRGPIHLTRQQSQEPAPGGLQAWPIPFRQPLLAVAGESGSPVGAEGSEAFAVGEGAEIAHYTAEQGWLPERVSGGHGQPPRFRAAAWPAKYGPFAVGDEGAMWVDLRGTAEHPEWEPDGGAPPGMENVDLTGIAFDELDNGEHLSANRVPGWVVGTKGTLLGFAAAIRHWEKYAVPQGVDQDVDFSSVAFAGDEALATYKRQLPGGGFATDGGADAGLLVNTPQSRGWEVDQEAIAALGGSVPEKVAGLADGGAVVASLDGKVIERDGPEQPWRRAPPGPGGYPAALAAFREGGAVRAAISLGSAPDPYQPPIDGYLLRQTASGWRDEEHEAFPLPSGPQESANLDYPVQPDAVLGLILDPLGKGGWAVGGQTGQIAQTRTNRETIQTAAVMRYPAEGAPQPTGVGTVPIQPPKGVSFMIGGDAQCAGPCADLAGTGIGPDRWVSHAFEQAAKMKALSAILYTGSGVAEGLGKSLSPSAFARESRAYAARLSGTAGAPPVFAAPAATDLNGAGSLSTFAEAFSGFEAPFGSAPAEPGIVPISPTAPGKAYYSFETTGNTGAARVIVLDYSAPLLGAHQRCWLAQQLYSAGDHRTPAIVVGSRDFNPEDGAPDSAESDPLTNAILLGLAGTEPGGCSIPGADESVPTAASAYFFDYPGRNRFFTLAEGGRVIPVIGTGTLGYGNPLGEKEQEVPTFSAGASYLLASIQPDRRDPGTNQAPLAVEPVDSVGQLALDPVNGTSLKMGGPALFVPAARRPVAGMRCIGYPECSFGPDPYGGGLICLGGNCDAEVVPAYAFTSSNPGVARFIVAGAGTDGQPQAIFPEPPDAPVLSSYFGILCPISPGTTRVAVSAGGLSRSLNVTVSPGEGSQCGLGTETSELAGQPLPGVSEPLPTPTVGVSPFQPTPSPATPAKPPVHQPAPPVTVTTQSTTPVPFPVPVIVPLPSPPLAQALPPPASLPATLSAPAPAPVPVPGAASSPVPAPGVVTKNETEVAREDVHQMTAVRAAPNAPAALAAFDSPGGGSGPSPLLYALPALSVLAAFGFALAYRSTPHTRPAPAPARLGRGPRTRA